MTNFFVLPLILEAKLRRNKLSPVRTGIILGACPRIRRGRAHGACEASSRREEEGDVEAHRRRRATKRSPATPTRPWDSGRRGGICGVGAPRRCALTSPASRRLASAPSRSAAGATVPGTRPLLILGQAPSRSCCSPFVEVRHVHKAPPTSLLSFRPFYCRSRASTSRRQHDGFS